MAEPKKKEAVNEEATAKNQVFKVASISTKSIGFSSKEIRKIVEDSNEVHLLARIGGVALDFFTGTSKHGEWQGFKGIFTLVTRDGRTFTSSVVYLPKNITDKLYSQMQQGVVEVSFLVDINVTASDKNASGYAFNVDAVRSEAAEQKAKTISDTVIGSMQKMLALK